MLAMLMMLAGAQLIIAQTVTDQQTAYKVGDRGPAGGIVFYDKGWYWSSSQLSIGSRDDSRGAWAQRFSGGSQAISSKDDQNAVRAVRVFADSKPPQSMAPATQSNSTSRHYFLEKDLVEKGSFRFLDGAGQPFDVVWPVGISEQGLRNAAEGAFWSGLLGSAPLAQPAKRQEVYTNIFYALATRPALNAAILDQFGWIHDLVGELEPAISANEKMALAYHVLAYGDLRYMKDANAFASVLNHVKTVGRSAQEMVQSPSFGMAAEALSVIGITLQ
jgi:hypothetical protein